MKGVSAALTATETKRSLVNSLREVLVQVGLVVLGAVLYSLAYPSVISQWGWFPVAYFSLIPVFIVVRRTSWVGSFLIGALYGFVTYSILNYWLLNFHPLAIFIVPVIYAGYFLVVFPLLKLADTLFPRYGYLVQVLIWLAYEYLRLQGFLGYAYGIAGYSQYLFLPLIGISSFAGVWGVSFLVVFPNAFLAHLIMQVRAMGSRLTGADAAGANAPGARAPVGRQGTAAFRRRNRWIAGGFLVLFLGAIVFGLVSRSDYSDARRWRMSLVQQNIDPWRGGAEAYRKSLDILVEQSNRALADDPDIIVWSETSFVPPIEYHNRYRTNRDSYELVQELMGFLGEQDIPYVIGNGDAQLVQAADGNLERVDYNAVLLYENGEIQDTYRKVHLVPFTEHFPYQRTFPWIHRILVENDTTFWEAGDEYTIFESDGIRFSTPICFEDTFGYLSRNFVRAGADLIVNLTNDSWAYSEAAAMQHMQMAVFRAVENKRTVVRSTNGGMTTVIDPNGRILAMLPAFTEDYLTYDVPVYTDETTLYTRWGNWLALVFLFGAAAALLFGIGRALWRRAVK